MRCIVCVMEERRKGVLCPTWSKNVLDFKSTIFSLCVCTEVQVVSLHGGEVSDRVTVRLWLVRPGVGHQRWGVFDICPVH